MLAPPLMIFIPSIPRSVFFALQEGYKGCEQITVTSIPLSRKALANVVLNFPVEIGSGKKKGESIRIFILEIIIASVSDYLCRTAITYFACRQVAENTAARTNYSSFSDCDAASNKHICC